MEAAKRKSVNMSSSVVTPKTSARSRASPQVWVWASISPGSSVAPAPSTTSTPSGTATSGPTAAISPPCTTTVAAGSTRSPSKTRAPTTAKSVAVGGGGVGAAEVFQPAKTNRASASTATPEATAEGDGLRGAVGMVCLLSRPEHAGRATGFASHRGHHLG